MTTAAVVVSASALAEAFGPLWGALIATLPVSSGPAYVFLALQHDAGFVAACALSSYATNAATGVYLVLYARLARTRSLVISLGSALFGWFAVALLALQIEWTPWTATLLNLIVYTAAYWLLKDVFQATITPLPVKAARWFDLPARAVAVAGFVTFVVLASNALGPEATGIAAVFPITFTSLLIILNPRIGGPTTALLAANAVQAMIGFGLMLLVLHLTFEPWGAIASLLTALAVSLAWSVGMLATKGRLKRRSVAS